MSAMLSPLFVGSQLFSSVIDETKARTSTSLWATSAGSRLIG